MSPEFRVGAISLESILQAGALRIGEAPRTEGPADMTMALRRPHKRMKMVMRRAIFSSSGRLTPPYPWTPAFAGVTKWGAG